VRIWAGVDLDEVLEIGRREPGLISRCPANIHIPEYVAGAPFS